MNQTELLAYKATYNSVFRQYLNSPRKTFKPPFLLSKSIQYALYFLAIERPLDMCAFFKIHHQELEDIINQPTYVTHFLLKKKQGLRTIKAPIGTLKLLQQKLNRHLQGVYLNLKPTCAKGFVINPPGSSLKANIVENALPHVAKKYVLNMDIRDFFTSISDKQIYHLFKSSPFDFSPQIAAAFTYLVTVDDCLPQGAPTSPILSNFACRSLDEKLMEFANHHQLNYTRYADDLTFSSDIPFTKEQIATIKKTLREEGFEPNEKKFRLRTSNKKQLVTGLVVNEKVNVDRKMLKRVRAILHDLRLNGASKAAQNFFKSESKPNETDILLFFKKLRGMIDFIGQVRGKEDVLFVKMRQDYSSSFAIEEDRMVYYR
ncbi:MAG: RNA-directed DNA polymerase [Flavobacteriales bacterium]|nr:RNA-directed DNA polymerase [Flavobacteriales bacterium]